MEKNASGFGYGIASWYFPEHDDDGEEFLGKTSDGIYFPVRSLLLGPSKNMTFRPDFFESAWNNDYKAVEFERILNEKVGVKSKRVDSVLMTVEGLVGEYVVN